MNVNEQLARIIYNSLSLDYYYRESSIKKVIYQLLYIGLTRLYGSEHITLKDIKSQAYMSENNMPTVCVNVLGKELYFYIYDYKIQAVDLNSQVILDISAIDNNSFELYVFDIFKTTFRYRVSDITENQTAKYSYTETQGDRTISHGDLITVDVKDSKIADLFKMIPYDLSTGEVIPNNESFFKKLGDSIKGDSSTKTTFNVLMSDQSGQINNIIFIFDVLKVRLERYYASKNKQSGKGKTRSLK